MFPGKGFRFRGPVYEGNTPPHIASLMSLKGGADLFLAVPTSPIGSQGTRSVGLKNVLLASLTRQFSRQFSEA